MTVGEIIDLISRGGAIAMFVFIIWSGSRDDPLWVFGWSFRKLERERDWWQEAALRSTDLAERTSTMSEREIELHLRELRARLEYVEESEKRDS